MGNNRTGSGNPRSALLVWFREQLELASQLGPSLELVTFSPSCHILALSFLALQSTYNFTVLAPTMAYDPSQNPASHKMEQPSRLQGMNSTISGTTMGQPQAQVDHSREKLGAEQELKRCDLPSYRASTSVLEATSRRDSVLAISAPSALVAGALASLMAR